MYRISGLVFVSDINDRMYLSIYVFEIEEKKRLCFCFILYGICGFHFTKISMISINIDIQADQNGGCIYRNFIMHIQSFITCWFMTFTTSFCCLILQTSFNKLIGLYLAFLFAAAIFLCFYAPQHIYISFLSHFQFMIYDLLHIHDD